MRRFIVFSLGKDTFAINVGYAVKVIRSVPAKHVPEAPDFVDGIIKTGGRIYPVINIRKRLDLTGESGHGAEKLLILRSPHGSVALAVDNVLGVEYVSRELIEKPDMVFRGIRKRYLEGLYAKGDSMHMILNIKDILTSEEYVSIKKACGTSEETGA